MSDKRMNKLLFLLIIIFSGSALSCGDYVYARIAYGGMISNLNISGHKDSYEAFDAATFDLGYKWKLSDEWYFDLQFQHTSQYFTGFPFNNDPELTSEHISVGLEYRNY